MVVEVKYATGRATCKHCKEKIAKGEVTVMFVIKGYTQIIHHHHLSCIENKVKELRNEI